MSSQMQDKGAAANGADARMVFLDAAGDAAVTLSKTWKIVIADDDPEVHVITQMVLRDLVFDGRRLELLFAHTGRETLRLLAEHPDTAVLLLDVVMENEHAGLDVARGVREILGNRFVRIILRTGQPGQAPEKRVIVDFDINDYKEKTELTAQKLTTVVISALRSFRDLVTIERSRQGLTRVINASRDLFETHSLACLSSGVLQQISALLHLGDDGILARSSGLAASLDADDKPGKYTVLAGTGRFTTSIGQVLDDVLSRDEIARLMQLQCEQTIVGDGEFSGRFCSSNGAESFIMVQTQQSGQDLEVDLLRLFAANISAAFDNAHLHEELLATQAEFVNTLSEVVEARSNESGLHVFRVGEMANLLGQLAGHSERECTLLRLTAPMHDLGKVGIPDHILHKPGPLTAQEWATMRDHTCIGHKLLCRSRRPALQAAAIIAEQHHEWWNGGGYPYGLKGDEIHAFGRIVAIIDVFDALSHLRSYKQAWDMPRVIEYISGGSGRQFDPVLAALFLAHVDEFIELANSYPDLALK